MITLSIKNTDTHNLYNYGRYYKTIFLVSNRSSVVLINKMWLLTVFLKLILIFFILIMLLSLLWYLNLYRYFKYLKKIPGPTPLPIIGNILEMKSLSDVLPKMVKWKAKYGDFYKVVAGFQPIGLVVTDYKFTEFLLGSHTVLNKSLIYDYVGNWLGTGLLTSKATKWKKLRKIITPAFHFKILEQFVEVFEKNANIMADVLRQEINSSSFDIYPYVTLMALDVICETALGTEINAQRDTHSEYVNSVKAMCWIVIYRMLNPFYANEFIYSFSKLYRQERRALAILHNTTMSVIRRKKKEIEEKPSAEKVDEDLGIKKKLAFLDLLLHSTIDGQLLSDRDLREEVDTFMFAGHDTTASALSFALYNLSVYPEVQRKVVEEIRNITLDDAKKHFTYTDLQEMKYLEAVIKETLRLYPSVPMIGRIPEEDIEYNGLTIPSGTQIVVPIYCIMRDANYFPEPEKFDPDRFLTNNKFNQLPYSYIPFSAGPRNCIGQKFAMLEMKSAISTVLRHYELLPAEPRHDLILNAEITLKSANGIKIRIKERRL